MTIDFEQMKKLERRLDRMAMDPDPAVRTHVQAARDSLKAKDYDLFEEEIKNAEQYYVAPARAVDVAIKLGAVISLAQFRRLLKSGKVQADGKVVRKHDQDISEAKKLTVGNKTYKLQE